MSKFTCIACSIWWRRRTRRERSVRQCETELPEGNPVVLIGGERSVTIMKVISTDASRHWSVQAVTEELGEPREAVRRNRAVLETLCDRGALVRQESADSDRRGKKKVFYQLAAPWQAA